MRRALARLREAGASAADGSLPGGGLLVCALDTELLGHWWYEGVVWLRAVVEECASQGLTLVRLDDALERHQWPRASTTAEAWPPSSWGEGGDLSTWSGPAVAEMAFAGRAAELQVLAAGGRAGAAAVRELLALQASDWPFMVSRGIASPYAHERFNAHHHALARALAAGADADLSDLRNLAADADPAHLLVPS